MSATVATFFSNSTEINVVTETTDITFNVNSTTVEEGVPSTTLVMYSTTVVSGPQGPQGEVGPPSEYTNKYAAEVIGGHKVVALGPDDKVVLASNLDSSHFHRVIGISKNAAIVDDNVLIQVRGYLTDVSFSFVVGDIFLGTNGYLTQTPPDSPATFSLVIGYAVSSNEIFINIQDPTFIGS